MIQWRKYRVNGEERDILVPDYLEPLNDASQKRSRDPFIPSWIGAVSQLAMLIVVLFGYIYTVKPVFQYQLLQENLASAELDRLEVEGQVEVLQAERDEAEQSLKDLENQISSIEAERAMLEGDLEEAKVRAMQAQSDASRLEGIVQEQLNELDVARWELLMLDFNRTHVINFRHRHWDANALNLGLMESERFPEYLQRYIGNWPDLLLTLQSSIERLREQNANEPRYPESYIDEFSEFIASRKNELTCIEPPFSDLEASFQNRYSEIEGVVEEKTDEYIEGLIAEYREEGTRVLITDEIRDRQARLYRVMEEHKLDREFKGKVREYTERCRSVTYEVLAEFRELKGVTR